MHSERVFRKESQVLETRDTISERACRGKEKAILPQDKRVYKAEVYISNFVLPAIRG